MPTYTHAPDNDATDADRWREVRDEWHRLQRARHAPGDYRLVMDDTVLMLVVATLRGVDSGYVPPTGPDPQLRHYHALLRVLDAAAEVLAGPLCLQVGVNPGSAVDLFHMAVAEVQAQLATDKV